jgi:hypothetical protein
VCGENYFGPRDIHRCISSIPSLDGSAFAERTLRWW